jgi:hypothetical protein
MGRREKNPEGKKFPLIGKVNLFYLLYRDSVLLSVTLRDK